MSKELIDYTIQLVKDALGSHLFNYNVESQVREKAYAKFEELLKNQSSKDDNSTQQVNSNALPKGKNKQK
jgi:hypothetical protein